MNTVSLDLCKELYELSGWNDSDKWYCLKNFTTDPEYELEDSPIVADYIPDGNIPAYDLGFMLRKLPKKRVKLRNYLRANQTSWKCQFSIDDGGHTYDIVEEARSPEDAACKLLCELIRQGVLKP